MVHGLVLEYFNRARLLREVHVAQRECLVPQTILIALVFTESFWKARLHLSVLFLKHVSELDHGHRVPKATLKLETGL